MVARRYIKKVSLLGDGGVGKTSLVRRFVQDMFSDEYITTFGAKVSKKVIELDDIELTMMIWDILGQKGKASLHSTYYSGTNGALVMCDLTRPETLEGLVRWAAELKAVTGEIPIIPIANKSDLSPMISQERLHEVGSIIGHDFLQTSAKSGEGVQAAFLELGRSMLEAR